MEAGGVLGEEGGAELGGHLDPELGDLLVVRPPRHRAARGAGSGIAVPFMAAMRFTPATLMKGMTPGSTGLSQPSSASSSTMRR